MIANYHTHTARCRHAWGTEKDFVEEAISQGMSTLGFSDHTPYIFPGGYRSSFRMDPEEAKGYFDAVRALKEEYKDKINIHVGLEVEYYPSLFPKLCRFLKEFAPDYFLLGQHFTGNEYDSFYIAHSFFKKSYLWDYLSQVTEALDSGLFTYLAHPDLPDYDGDDRAAYEKFALELCEACKKRDIPIELNLLGIKTGRHYPNHDFFRIAGAVQNKVILGCDAHSVQDFSPLIREKGYAIAEKYSLNLIADTKLIKPNI